MPRAILEIGSGAQTADVRASVMTLPGVTDAVTASQGNAVIVSVEELDQATRDELANQPGVSAVFDDLQGRPLVADEDELDDFFRQVKEVRGEENVPPSVAAEATKAGEETPITDGGAVILPQPTNAETAATPEGPLRNATDAVEHAGAPDLHDQGVRGESIISVIVDTGSCAESIRSDRQLEGADLSQQDDPWDPLAPHGGMSTGIMAGDETTPGIEVGFLPESDVFPIKTTLAASELIQAQDIIAQLADRNPEKTIVVNNSWGFPECSGICEHPVTGAIQNTAGGADIIQVFAAGNEGGGGATDCGGACDGSTPGISGPNSLGEVITVAASGKNGIPESLQDYSSRGGPGNISCGSQKPDVAAPIFGEVPYGCGARSMGNGGGTSAACPQVAGAVGLLADAGGRVSTTSASTGLQQTANQFDGDDWNGCSGAGNVQVADAAEAGVGAGLDLQTAGGSGVVIAAGTIGLVGAVLRRWLS